MFDKLGFVGLSAKCKMKELRAIIIRSLHEGAVEQSETEGVKQITNKLPPSFSYENATSLNEGGKNESSRQVVIYKHLFSLTQHNSCCKDFVFAVVFPVVVTIIFCECFRNTLKSDTVKLIVSFCCNQLVI